MAYWQRVHRLFLPVLLVLLACTPAKTQVPNGLPTGGSLPMAIAADRSGQQVIYVALKQGGVQVMDTSGAGAVRPMATITRRQLGGMDAMNLHLKGRRLYVALGDHFRAGGAHAGLAIINVRDPSRPRVVGRWRSAQRLQGASDLTVKGGVAYLGAMKSGVIAIDVSTPKKPLEISRFRPDPGFPIKRPGLLQIPAARGLAVDGNRLFVAYDAGGLRVLDISDPHRMREVGRYINPSMGRKPSAYNNLVVRGGNAYAAIDYCGVEIIRVRDLTKLRQIGWWNPWGCEGPGNNWFNSPGHTNQIVWLPGDRLGFSSGDAEMVVLDVSKPKRPRMTETLGRHQNGLGTWSIGADSSSIYLGYIRTPIPFRGRWSGVRRLKRR